MITVPSLAISDTDTTATGLTTRPADGAQDFLALLTDAMSGNAPKTGHTALSQTELPAASRQLPSEDAKTAGDQRHQPLADNALILNVADSAQLPILTPQLKSGLAQMMKQEETPDASERASDDNALAGLSALMAMLPQIAPATTATPQEQNATSGVPLANGHAHEGKSAAATVPLAIMANDDTAADHHPAPMSQTASLVAAAALKTDNDSVPSPTAMAVTPAITPTTSSIATHPVASVNAQLGTPEWQQSVSQHVTLFSRQGQHTAELKLHPQDLGQVHITLRLDDNQAQLQMMSAHSHVRAALEAALPVLRTQLADNGIQLAQSNISSDSSTGQQQHSAFQQPASQHAARERAMAADEDELLSVPTTLQSAARGTGAVDIFA